ncbi:hypothetical protein [Paucibacter sp. Y2R2-4]|uniref:hypothetical protein n=1 Tax=Paucibacter sp. Y2R2-4 TaxID=2893553 RepID=UPI0021E43812|nr:hypothetical protein [Paucibacter sp. Y2R2-4]MCV2349494.1 hypothetical protein [Paucibacter sp. Y2R2-4]
MLPTHWLQFVDSNHLAGKSASFSEDVDLSTLGADMGFLNETQSATELTDFWPGIGVAKDGYVPVAWCSEGSGDYYYINTNDGPNGPLYRIYHDAVGPDGYSAEDAVVKVLNHYEELLVHVDP